MTSPFALLTKRGVLRLRATRNPMRLAPWLDVIARTAHCARCARNSCRARGVVQLKAVSRSDASYFPYTGHASSDRVSNGVSDGVHASITTRVDVLFFPLPIKRDGRAYSLFPVSSSSHAPITQWTMARCTSE
jgi:hypothetical protein